MQEPQHVAKFDLRRMETHDLSANATELRPIALRAHATAIDNNSCIEECAVLNESFPVRLDSCFCQGDGNRLQEGAIIQLRFIRNVQSLGKACAKGRFEFARSRTVDLFDRQLLRSELSLCANGFSGVFAMPEQEGSIVTIKDWLRQFSQPSRPEGQAMLPHGRAFCIDINRFPSCAPHPPTYPRHPIFSFISALFLAP